MTTNNHNKDNIVNNDSNHNVIDSKYRGIAIPLVPISRFLIEKLRFHSKKTFLLENETKNTYTFDEVADDSLRMATVLSANGLKDGQHFGICGHNSYEFITTLIGGLIAGGVAVPVNAHTPLDTISQLIKRKHINYMTITTRNQKSLSNQTLKRFQKGLKTIVSFAEEVNDSSTDTGVEVEDNTERDEYQSYRSHITSHECKNESHIGVIKSIDPKTKNCLLIDTNGSFDASKSKSCFLTDYNLLSQLTISSLPVTGFNWSSTDTVLNTTPFTHINGLIQLFAALTTGSRFVIMKNDKQSNSATDICKAIEEWGVSAALFTPQTIVEMIKDESLDTGAVKSLKKVICTGSSMPKNIGHKFITKYGVEDFRQAYGMTEMCGFATIEPIGSRDNETCGVPVPSVSIKIVDTDTDIALGAGQVGEVCVKSPQLFNGYLSTGVGGIGDDLRDAMDADGWFHTNDIGYYDRNNKLQIVDPVDDFIQYKGLHISPTSLEAILLSHFNVKEVAIFGAYHRIHGQTPTALVVVKKSDNNNNNNHSINEEVLDMAEVLKNFMNDHLTQQNIAIDELYIVDEIPKTISGKMNRTDLTKFVNETIVNLKNNNNNNNTSNKFVIDF